MIDKSEIKYFKTSEIQLQLASDCGSFISTNNSEKLSDCSDYSVIQSKNGFPVLLKNEKPVHSRHDPVLEAERAVKNAVSTKKKYYLLFGSGLGYSVYLILKNHQATCIWFEPDFCILSEALKLFDYSEYFKNKKLIIINHLCSSDEMDSIFSGIRNSDIEFVVHRPVFDENSDYRRFFRKCEDHLNKKDVNMATLSRFEKTWASNFSRNLCQFIHARPVQHLFINMNVPILVCGAGPSLTFEIKDIKKYRNKFILIAVDTALKILNNYNIDPDITLTVDPQPINREYIEGYRGNSLFVCDVCSSYLAVRSIPESKCFIFKSPFPLTEILYENMPEIPEALAFGGSVSTNAYDLAVRMGSKNIYLAGMDLSFPNLKAHASGAVLEEKLNFLESRVFRREMHNYRQLTALPVRFLPGLDGKDVQTNDKLIIFYKWFSGRFQTDQTKNISIINTTAAGVKIPGSTPGSLAQLSHLPDIYFDKIIKTTLNQKLKHAEVHKIETFLDTFLDELKDYRKLCEEGITLSKTCFDRIKKEGKYIPEKEILNRLDFIDSVLLKNSKLTSILSGVIQKTLNILEENEKTESKDKGLLMKKSILLYTELSGACTGYIKLFKRTGKSITYRQNSI